MNIPPIRFNEVRQPLSLLYNTVHHKGVRVAGLGCEFNETSTTRAINIASTMGKVMQRHRTMRRCSTFGCHCTKDLLIIHQCSGGRSARVDRALIYAILSFLMLLHIGVTDAPGVLLYIRSYTKVCL